MASTNHLNLSDFIKKVHQDLRNKSAELGAEGAWESHCSDEITLHKYAQTMRDLATNYWDKNLTNQSRVSWTYNVILEYFREKISSIQDKEQTIARKLGINLSKTDVPKDKWKLLDVGSCYNPFGKFSCFEVTPIDIAPASEDVLKCDFLHVEIAEKTVIQDKKLSSFKREHFDIVVFCLLLEYLPNADQRRECCQKAYQLLKTEGILVIITPDSNHVGSNAKLIKSWRFILAQMGFSRIKYEKLSHVHCMVFRKSFHPDIPIRWAALNKHCDVYDKILIPQDFKTIYTNAGVNIKSEIKNEDEFTLIEVMPFQDLFDGS